VKVVIIGNRTLADYSVSLKYCQQLTSTSTFSFTRKSHATDTIAIEERGRQQDEVVQNLMQMNQHILGILHVRVSYMFNLSNAI
jgi:hypothetical protein